MYTIILYCDFTSFCTEFSKTFRQVQVGEHIATINRRNSRFYHTARYLRECVQYYGSWGASWGKNTNRREEGPFYTGMSFVMNIPEFTIGLQGPTSTSKQKAVAVRFAGDGGLVIKLNNSKGNSTVERFIDSSWISCYPEEDERIFFGSVYQLTLQTIIIIDSGKNYKQSIAAYSKFDQMLNNPYEMESINAKDVAIIDESIKYVLGEQRGKGQLDEYTLHNFYAFTRRKTQIGLCLPYMNKYIDNTAFSDFIMQPIKESGSNLFKPVIFKLFLNLTKIGISTRDSRLVPGYYPLDLVSSLSMLKSSSIPHSLRSIVIDEWYNPSKHESGEWLAKAASPDLLKQYAKSSFQVDLKTQQQNKAVLQLFQDIKVVTVFICVFL